MRAIRYHGKGDVRLEEVQVPECAKGEVQIKPAFVGLCGTDVHEYEEGPLLIPASPHPVTKKAVPIIIGHEYSGTVTGTGDDVHDLEPGDRVVVQPIIFDGTCKPCQRGLINCCTNSGFLGLSGIGGGLVDYTTVPRYAVFKIPDHIPLDIAALTEPLAVAWHAVHLSGLEPNGSALVLGAGPIGLAVLQVLRSQGAGKVIVSELAEKRKQIAERFGADIVLDPSREDVGARCRELCEDGLQVVFDCVGLQASLDAALVASAPRAVIVNVAIWAREANMSPNLLMLNERIYRGSATYCANDFQQVIDAIAQGKLNPEGMVTSKINLEETEEKGIKALIHEKENHIKILVKI